MIEYYFLFSLAIVYCVIASIQDVRKTVVNNWVTFSFALFALAYRAFYAFQTRNFNFFILGLLGFLIFYVIGNLFYYSKAFGGADVKLLRGIGVILPYKSYYDLLVISFGFIIILFVVAFIYTLLYSILIVIRNNKKFANEFKEFAKSYNLIIVVGLVIGLLLIFFSYKFQFSAVGMTFGLFLILLPILYVYLKSVDECMVNLTKPDQLLEGDWILEDLKIGKYLVKNTVHGLTLTDINALKKAKKSIYVKNGIPFVPVILISVLIMVFFYLISGQNWLLSWFLL